MAPRAFAFRASALSCAQNRPRGNPRHGAKRRQGTSFARLPLARMIIRLLIVRIVPPDEYSGAVAYLHGHGYSIKPVDSLGSADAAAARTRVNGKDLTAEEVVSLAVEKGWELP